MFNFGTTFQTCCRATRGCLRSSSPELDHEGPQRFLEMYIGIQCVGTAIAISLFNKVPGTTQQARAVWSSAGGDSSC